MNLFAVGEEPNHHVGDKQCPVCWEEYPEPCQCGGLMHAAGVAEEDSDGNVAITTRCDRCGRSEARYAPSRRPPALFHDARRVRGVIPKVRGDIDVGFPP